MKGSVKNDKNSSIKRRTVANDGGKKVKEK